jgi:uncharacterized protein YjiS (DUF1127 family)
MSSIIAIRPTVGRATVKRFADLLQLIQRWHARERERVYLAEMSDHQWKDLGLSRADLAAELSKPFWRR